MTQTWNAQNYDAQHAFVWKAGASVLEWLSPQPRERILDVGCGTAHLTAQIAASGASVVGLDSSPEMLDEARQTFPHLELLRADARDFAFDEPFDAVFSNATLHWISQIDTPRALACIERALKPNGRFVFEMGGRGNVSRLVGALEIALRAIGRDDALASNFFPSVGEYATLLEAAGFSVSRAELFPRPTPLSNGERGLRDWLTTFRAASLEPLSPEEREEALSRAETLLCPALWNGEVWTADYVRLRMLASK